MLETTWDLFLPFVAGERFIFQCKHTRELWAQLSEDDRAKLPWDPEAIDWRQYWMEVHMRGLEEWVFPGLEEERRPSSARWRSRRTCSPSSRRPCMPSARGWRSGSMPARTAPRELARTRDDDLLRRAGPVLRPRGRALQARGVKRATACC